MARFDVLSSIPGIGEITAIAMLIDMPALVATRFNPDMKAKYKALVAAGKPPEVAITAVMRKLVIVADALLKADRKWTPKLA